MINSSSGLDAYNLGEDVSALKIPPNLSAVPSSICSSFLEGFDGVTDWSVPGINLDCYVSSNCNSASSSMKTFVPKALRTFPFTDKGCLDEKSSSCQMLTSSDAPQGLKNDIKLKIKTISRGNETHSLKPNYDTNNYIPLLLPDGINNGKDNHNVAYDNLENTKFLPMTQSFSLMDQYRNGAPNNASVRSHQTNLNPQNYSGLTTFRQHQNTAKRNGRKKTTHLKKETQVPRSTRKRKTNIRYFFTPGKEAKFSFPIKMNISNKIETPQKCFNDDQQGLTEKVEARGLCLKYDNNKRNDINNNINENKGDCSILYDREKISFEIENSGPRNGNGTTNDIVSKRALREQMLPQEVRVKRRRAANARERKRVNKITDAFERLREHVPNLIKERKLSKFETLQMAMAYIDALDQGLNLSESGEETSTAAAAARARVIVAQSSAKWRLQRWLENKLGVTQKISTDFIT